MKTQYQTEESYENLKESATELNHLLQENYGEIAKNALENLQANFQVLGNINSIYQEWLNTAPLKPQNIVQTQIDLWVDYLKLCENLQTQWAGKETIPLFDPLQLDRRFKSDSWREKPLFHFIQQNYLLLSQHCLNFIKNNPSPSPKLNKQVAFFTKQYLDAISPTNFILTSPEILCHTFESKGENITNGIKNVMEDIIKGQGHWNIKMTDMEAFTVGKDIATTKGDVIFQNKMFELIRYSPLSKQVYTKPLLIVPPWINKYYILDLREHNSFVRWVVEQGFTVFMISWVNPDASYKEVGFDDYMEQGLIQALNIVCESTGEKSIHALGFCIGGTLLACALGYLQAKKDQRIATATFLTSLIDFSDPGEIDVFIDEKWVTLIEERMAKEGYLDGRILMTTFNMLRANDLWWAYYINNYLCGQKPFPFDLLYWNCDSTNLPAKMHSFYLRKMYLENKLCMPGKLTLGGVKINLSKVKIPAYFLSAEKDHIAPWKTTFYGAKCLGGETTFVLGESGHIAGVVNPPQAEKYGYRTGPFSSDTTKGANAWLELTQATKGSWWPHWRDWLIPQSGDLIDIAKRKKSKYPPLREAPGHYVQKRLV